MKTPEQIFAATVRYVDQRLAQGNTAMKSPDISEFLTLARAIALSKGNIPTARDYADRVPNVPRAQMILRSAVSAANLSDPAWAGALTGYNDLVQSFLGTLVDHSAFDAMLASTRRAPLHTRISAVTVPFNATIVGNGAGIPVSRLTLAPFTLEEIKAAALVVTSDELLRESAPGAANFLRYQMQTAVGTTTDAQFIAILEAAAAHTRASTGATASAIRSDIARAIDDLDLGTESTLFLLVPPKIYQRLSVTGTSTGAGAFPDMADGRIGRIEVRPSDALVGNSAGATAILVDADAVVANSDTITLDASNQAAIQMADPTTQNSVTPTATTLTSLWQTNSIGLRCVRYFGATVARANGVSIITGVEW